MSSSGPGARLPSPERLDRSLRLRRLRFPRTRPRGGPHGYVDGLGWLAGGLLWIDGWLTLAPLKETAVRFEIAGTRVRRQASCFTYPKAASPAPMEPRRWVVVVPVGAGFETASRVRRTALETPWGDLLWLGGYDHLIAPDVVDRLRHPSLPVPLLARLGPFLETAVRRHGADRDDPTLRRNLEALRRRWAADSEVGPRPDPLRQRLHLEEALACPGGLLYFAGWTAQCDDEEVEASILLQTGERLPLLSRAVFEPRSDVVEALDGRGEVEPVGFQTAIALERAAAPGPARLCLHGPADEVSWTPIETEPMPALELRERVVEHLGKRSSSLPAMGFELLHDLSAAARREQKVARREIFGVPAARPETSVIVTLLEPPDLLEHRFLGLQRSESRAPCEVLLVASPAACGKDLGRRVEGLVELYDVPVTLIQLAQETTWATASEIGAREARGELLLFCHGHTLSFSPSGPATLVEPFASDPSIGITAPAIAHFDGAIRSAGIRIGKLEELEPGSIRPVLMEDGAAPAVTVRLEACSADCFAVRRRLFGDLGSFAGLFFDPDFETVDLCLRAAAAGYDAVRAPTVFTRLVGGEEPRSAHSAPRTLAHQYDLESLRRRHCHRFSKPAATDRDPAPAERADERVPAAPAVAEVEGSIR